jgi:hypothetical protein
LIRVRRLGEHVAFQSHRFSILSSISSNGDSALCDDRLFFIFRPWARPRERYKRRARPCATSRAKIIKLGGQVSDRDRPELAAVGAVVGSEEDLVADAGEGAGGGGVGAGVDVAEAEGAGGGAVARPGLDAVDAVVGGEDEAAGDVGELLRRGARRAGAEVGDQARGGGVPFARPQLGAGRLVVDDEE